MAAAQLHAILRRRIEEHFLMRRPLRHPLHADPLEGNVIQWNRDGLRAKRGRRNLQQKTVLYHLALHEINDV